MGGRTEGVSFTPALPLASIYKFTAAKPSKYTQDFPGGSVVKKRPSTAGDSFRTWSGEIPSATEQLTLSAAAAEARVPVSPPSTTGEAPVRRSQGTAARRSPRASEDPVRPKMNKLIKIHLNPDHG